MRRILILAYYFPPIAASGSLRPAGFCSHLPSLDYQPLVLSTDYCNVHPAIAVDESLESLLSESLEIERIAHVNYQKSLLALRDKLRIARDRVHQTKDKRPNGAALVEGSGSTGWLKASKAAILDRLFRFPDQQKAWSSAAVSFACKLPAEKVPDIVMATGSPWSALVAGAKIAEHHKVPFVADFRDPWTRNPKPPLSHSLGVRAEMLESQVFSKATRIVANTPELGNEFAQQYPDSARKIVTITNGFHESLEEKFARIPSFVGTSGRVDLCYFGSIYELRRPTELLMALKKLQDSGHPDAKRLRVRLTGNWIVTDSYCNSIAAELEERGALIREPGVNHEEYLHRLKASHILLVLQQGFPLQIPGKIYEYIASGRPILVVGGEGATANLVKDSELGQVCENSVEGIAAMLMKLLKDQSSINPPNVHSVEQFNYQYLSKKLAKTLDSAIADYSAKE